MNIRSLTVLTLFGILVTPTVLDAATEVSTPNDPYFSYQTALTVNNSSSASVENAWGITTDASQVIVAVIDSGADLTHGDLKDNLWVNAAEIPGNEIDDDGNGYVDDVHGYDFNALDGEPEDLWGHGSLTSGIIGNLGNNSVGTAGVAWSVQLMELKVFGASGGAPVEDFVSAIDYAIDNGANIINASWTIKPTTPGDDIEALRAAIDRAREAGVIVITAAGNETENLGEIPVFPAAYDLDNVVSVGAMNAEGTDLLDISNYGKNTVSVAAVGENLLGSYLHGTYATLTGTSAATAFVSGVVALMVSVNPSLEPKDIKELLVARSMPLDVLQDKIASGGMLNPYESVQQALVLSNQASVTTQSAGGGTDSSSGNGVSSSGFGTAAGASGGCSLVLQ